ncbi:MAG: insulinase family protein, partial [Myxococcales bacterium]|nr:insulinase family protein [Myxococcales bacterium]
MFACSLLSTPAAAESVLANERYSLKNGLDVVLHVDRDLPMVAVNLSYHVGSGHEGQRRGLAHLTEHLMFRGTLDIDDGDYRFLMQDAGARVNASTFYHRTSYYSVLPSNQLALALWLEANRMRRLLPVLDGKKVEEEKQTTTDEWRERISSQRYGESYGELAALMYPGDHPWALATPQQIETLDLDAVIAFVERYHGPENATLVLAGDLPENVHELVRRSFRRCKGGQRPPVPQLSVPAVTAERSYARRDEFAH